jgi:hypothetical protein
LTNIVVDPPIEFTAKSRAPFVSLSVQDDTQRFTKMVLTSNGEPEDFAVMQDGNDVYRIGIFGTGPTRNLMVSKFSSVTNLAGPWTLIRTTGVDASICVFNNLLFVAEGSTLEKYSMTAGVFTHASYGGTMGTGTIYGVAGGMAGLYLYRTKTKTVAGTDVTYGEIVLLDWVNLNLLATWRGQIPFAKTTNIRLFCIGRMVYFQNDVTVNPPVMFEFDQYVSGSIQPIIPLDSLDDVETFSLLGAYNSNLGNVVTGLVTRKNGSSMVVYMQGNGEFTTGKSYLIDDATAENFMGEMIFLNGQPWYICANFVYSGNVTSVLNLGDYNPDMDDLSTPVTGIDNIQVQMSSNAPYSATFRGKAIELNKVGGVKKITPGAQINLKMLCGDASVTMPFVISSVGRVLDVNNTSSQIAAYSKYMSMLAEWESDSFYDYWSQSKSDGAAIDLTKMVPSSGTWTSTDVLYLKDLNVSGILYSTERATPGNYIRAHFVRNPSDYNAKVGLVVNFMQETIADAAKRLPAGTVVTQDMCLTKGIVISHDGSNVSVYHYRKDSKNGEVYTLLSTHPLVIDQGYWYWLSAKFVNGYLAVSYAISHEDDFYTPAFTNLFSEIVVFPSGFEWNNNYGRVGIYGMNSTITGKCFPLQAESEAVAIVDNSTFPASETVQIDSEQFTYSGKSQNVTSGEIAFALGDPKYGWSSFGAGNITLSHDKTTTVIWQRPYIGNSSIYINAVSVHITKVGNPLDGIELSIVDPSSNYGMLGSKRASCVKAASEIFRGGGWVTFKFGSRVQVNVGDVIQIMKSQKAAGCDGINYYVISGTASGGYQFGANIFNDNTDTWSAANTGFWYTLYSDPVSDPSVPSICASYDAGSLVETTNYYVNQALVVTSGSGEGTCMKISGSQKIEDGLMIFYVDRGISSTLDTSSSMKVYPSLYGLVRNNPTAHTIDKIDIYRDGTMLSVNEFACFSDEEDLSLEDVVRKIAMHAGVTKFSGKQLVENFDVGGCAPLQKRFMVFSLSYNGLSSTGAIDVFFWANSSTFNSANDLRLTITRDTISYYSGSDFMSSIPGLGNRQTKLKISMFNNYLSIWNESEYIHTFVITPSDVARNGTWFGVQANFMSPIGVDFPDACMRVDNYALDMGKTALSLIQQLIGNRRFYLQDGPGGLTLFRTRTRQNGTDTPYDRAISGTVTDAEPPFTRVMLEGGEVVEAHDHDNMNTYGNLFHRETINEIFTLQDAQDFATMYLDEAGASVRPVQFTGAIMPTLMPNDTLMVKFPASDPAVGTQISEVIIDGISYQINLTNQAALFDMNVTGRVK